MTVLALEHRNELPRWLFSAAIVLALHGALAAAMMHWRDADEGGNPTAAVVINLAPMPVSPTLDPLQAAPGPEQIQAETPQEVLAERVMDAAEETTEIAEAHEVQPEFVPAIDPEVVLNEAAPKAQNEVPAPEMNELPALVTTVPQVVPRELAAVAAAPEQPPVELGDPNAVPAWTRQVVQLLQRNKRYPATARARREKGTAQLAFSIDREGRVVSSRIVRSSGSAALDQETLDLVQRAQPFPRPPASMPAEQLEFTVPIIFELR